MSEAHKAMFQTFAAHDPHSRGLLNLLKEMYPAFAKQVFYKNPFMERVVMSGANPMNILDYPVCGRCETIAAWNGITVGDDGKPVRKCGCFAEGCGATTLNPVTLRTWMTEELRRKAPPDIAQIAEYAVDRVAATMMRMAMLDYEQALLGIRAKQQKQLGILLPDGSERKVDPLEEKKKQEYIREAVDKTVRRMKEEGVQNVQLEN